MSSKKVGERPSHTRFPRCSPLGVALGHEAVILLRLEIFCFSCCVADVLDRMGVLPTPGEEVSIGGN